MNVLQRLDNGKKYRGFKSLPIGYHPIERFRAVKTKYGKKEKDGTIGLSILVELKDEILFLPQFWCDKITPSDMAELNEAIENKQEVYLYFGGKYGETE